MSVNVVSFFRSAPRPRDWNNQELAEFYRVEASLIRSGMSVVTDRGLSDEGDPWFVFCNAETEDVIVHFARIDDLYVVASPAFNDCVRGRQFRPLIESLIESHPLVLAQPKGGGKLFIHPAALLVALVTTCFFKLGHTEAFAAEVKVAKSMASAAAPVVTTDSRGGGDPVIIDDRAAAVVLTAIATAVMWAQQVFTDTSTISFDLPTTTVEGGAVSAGVVSSDLAAWNGGSNVLSHWHALSEETAGVLAVSLSDVAPLLVESAHHGATSGQLNLLQKIVEIDLGVSRGAVIVWAHDPHATVLTPEHSEHVVPLPAVIGGANTLAITSTNGSTSTAVSAASAEISLVLGATAQAHTVNDISAVEPLLVLAATAPHQSASSDAGSTSTSTSTSSSATSSSSAASSAPSAPTNSTASGAEINHVIQQFVISHPDFQILNVSHEVIIYDPHLTPSNVVTATQETFTFQDGSSIFLIGLPASSAHPLVG